MKLVVVGAGPAGLAAAVTAAERGAEVVLLDENPRPGGQIWRHGPTARPPRAARAWLERMRNGKIEARFGTAVVGGGPGDLWLQGEKPGLERLACDTIILATGARELFLPFPGWTLPNVWGCGGAQALLKAGIPAEGLRIVIAGSGPLLFAVAAAFADKGAKVVGLVEQSPFSAVAGFAAGLWRHPGKLGQALGYAAKLLPLRPRFGAWVSRAHGTERLSAVEVTDGKTTSRLDCDILACGYGLLPNTELAEGLGCKLSGGKVAVDANQATTVAGVYCAGEGTGIGGEDVALLEGEIAALAALGDAGAEDRIARRRAWEPFLEGLGRAYRLRGEVLRLAEPDTVVCRCEDIPYGALRAFPDQRTAKLHTRCGMGPCQGRVCGAACRALFGWEPNRPRWPLTPVELGALSRLQEVP